jgi:hypothetical protein
VDSVRATKRGRKTIFELTAASRPSRSASNGSSSLASQSGAGRASLLSSATKGVWSWRKATLLPPAKPSLRGLRSTRTHG